MTRKMLSMRVGRAAVALSLALTSCHTDHPAEGSAVADARSPSDQGDATATAPWWRGGVGYEIFVRSFQDSNGDGIGDLQGVRQRLDYLKDLGVTMVWLMPIFPSPSYHGYDVTDYQGVNPDYGTLRRWSTDRAEGRRTLDRRRTGGERAVRRRGHDCGSKRRRRDIDARGTAREGGADRQA